MLDFLKNIKLQPNSAVAAPIARTVSAAAKTPTQADIRIFKNGSAYPSAALVGACGLAYMPKDSEDKGNGFDIFKSTDFLNTKDSGAKVLFIALVPRTEGRVDLFASTTYEPETGAPKADVLTQGAATAGKEILAHIKEMYGVEIADDQDFMDLVIVKDQPLTTEDNIYWIPKVVSRGGKAGQIDLQRRENLTIYPLVPASLIDGVIVEKEEKLVTTLDEIEAGHVEGEVIPEGEGMPEEQFLSQTEESFTLPDEEQA